MKPTLLELPAGCRVRRKRVVICALTHPPGLLFHFVMTVAIGLGLGLDYHKTCRVFLDHKLEPKGSSKSKSLRVSDIPHKLVHCQLHEDEILKFYCETCSSLICRDCMAIEHTGHTYNRLEKVVEKEKASLVSILSSTDLDGIQAKLDNAVVKGSKSYKRFRRSKNLLKS